MDLDLIDNALTFYAIVIGVTAAWAGSQRLSRDWRYRSLRKVWGFGRKDRVIIVCSELDNPEQRQLPEPREFIYSYKYGDLDALFEVTTTLLRLFPEIELRVASLSEFERSPTELDCHIVLIGGPDYNRFTERILEENDTIFDYRSPYSRRVSEVAPSEITLLHRSSGQEFYYTDDYHDYGYFERMKSCYADKKWIILIGGPHTVGVAGAAKALSVLNISRSETRATVLRNAQMLVKAKSHGKEMAILVKVQRVGAGIATPRLAQAEIRWPAEGGPRLASTPVIPAQRERRQTVDETPRPPAAGT